MSSRASLLVGSVLLLGTLGVLACSAPAPAGKALVVECDEGSDGCKEDGVKKKKPSETVPTDVTEEESPSQNPPPAPAANDAGTNADAGGVGAKCAALRPCCAALRVKGITGSADDCDSVYAANSEYGCYSALLDLSTPDDFYDPPAECRQP
jgi:hypothetical protein